MFLMHTVRSETILGNWKLFKEDYKCFLFYHNYFGSQDIWIFVLTFLSHRNMVWFKKVRFISKFVSQLGKQIIAIHILPNISKSKSNQKMKFCQVTEYNMRNIFSWNIIHKIWSRRFPAFLKAQNWAHLLINSLKFYTVCFYCMPSWGLLKYIKTKLQTTCIYIIWSFFKKRERSETSLPVANILLNSINWPNFWVPLLCEILVNICTLIVC